MTRARLRFTLGGTLAAIATACATFAGSAGSYDLDGTCTRTKSGRDFERELTGDLAFDRAGRSLAGSLAYGQCTATYDARLHQINAPHGGIKFRLFAGSVNETCGDAARQYALTFGRCMFKKNHMGRFIARGRIEADSPGGITMLVEFSGPQVP